MAGLNKALGALVAGSMLLSSTAVVAARPTPVQTQQVNPWAALAALSSGAPAAAVCGSAAATAAQSLGGCVLPVVDAAPPPPAPATVPPIAAAGPGVGLNPLALGLLALVAGIGLYLAVREGGDKGNTPT